MNDQRKSEMPDPDASDPLSATVALLRPEMQLSKRIEAGGDWQVRRDDLDSPLYCAVVEGVCRMEVAGAPAVTLRAGDFVLVPALTGLRMTSLPPPGAQGTERRLQVGPGVVRLGPEGAPVAMRALVGHCRFRTHAPHVVPTLLPRVIHVGDQPRLTALVRMIHDETRADRAGRTLALRRLLEVLLIEALRSGPGVGAAPGLLRGLADPRIAAALARIHDDPAGDVSVAALSRAAGLSRSGLFARFAREVGCTPAQYLTDWRMALARTLLREGRLTNDQIALRIGYGSASAFGMAFQRHAGVAPRAFASDAR
ncbi:cupin domain-containing protein [Paracoccus sp. ME4]|uniref:AraC family transcriptional regulator n=1 Tax=Paracoccus sp. ME4 TaxID=3138066 RepID=UPI00398BBBAD